MKQCARKREEEEKREEPKKSVGVEGMKIPKKSFLDMKIPKKKGYVPSTPSAP